MDDMQSRTARLAALKQAKRLLDADREDDAGDKPVLRFRNYELRDATIDHVKLPQAQPVPLEDPTPDTSQATDPLGVRMCDVTFADEEIVHAVQEDVLDVAPKKLNYDLKRDVEQKLQLLEKRTQRALIQLQQEEERKRIEQEGGIADAEGAPSDHSSENSE